MNAGDRTVVGLHDKGGGGGKGAKQTSEGMEGGDSVWSENLYVCT